MFNITFRNIPDNKCEAIIYMGDYDFEAAKDFFPFRERVVSKVRLVLASGIIIAMTVPQFLGAVYAAENGKPFSAAVFDNASTFEMRNFLKDSSKALNIISPDYFTLSDDGSLRNVGISQAFSIDMAKNGSIMLPTLTYDGPFTEEILKKGEEIGKSLIPYLYTYKLDGVIVDLPYGSQKSFSDFLEDMSRAVEGYTLGCVIYPQRNGYQYERLNGICGKIFVNTLTGRAQPYISPYYSVKSGEQTLRGVLSHGIDKDKLLLALDIGGRLWGPGRDGSTPVSPRQVEEITDLFAIKERFEKDAGSVFFDFTVGAGQNYYVGGTRLLPGNYTLNVGSSTYIREMLMLTSRLDIYGAALLNMPLAPSDLWEYFHNWLGKGYFSDISGTFGRDEIMKAYVLGIMHGVGEDKFQPYADITRGEAAAIVQRFLRLPLTDKKPPFSDTANHWAEKYISAAYYSGHMIGDIDGSFKPSAPLTREQAAMLAARLCKVQEKSSDGVFTDVESDRWSYESILALHKNGIIKGYEDGSFKPLNNVTREEMAIIVSRLDKFISF